MFGGFGSPCDDAGGAQTNTADYTVLGGVLGGLGSGQFDIGATNANGAQGPDGKLCMGGDLKFAVSGGGCNTATVIGTTWPSNPSNPNAWIFTHGCYSPSGELTLSNPTWNGTKAEFTAALNGSFNYGGRILSETSPSSPAGWDNCYVQGQEQQGGPPPFTTVTGNSVTLDGVNNYTTNLGNSYGSYYIDSVGRGSANIDWYRSHGRAPCGNQVYQQMRLSCDSGSTIYAANNYLQAGIGATSITSVRNGVGTTETYISPFQRTAAIVVNVATLLLGR